MKRLLTILLTILPLCVLAQENDVKPFTADRPGAVGGVDILPKGRLQLETGFGWERYNMSDYDITFWSLNSSLIRFGISDHAELRFQAERLLAVEDGEHTNGFANVAIGTKVSLFDGWKVFPAVAMQADVMVPGSKDAPFMPTEWGGHLGLLFEHHLTSWLAFGYEGDMDWLDSGRPIYLYGASFVFKPNDRLTFILDEFNETAYGKTDSFVELSACWMLSKRVQIDISSDIYLNYPGHYNCQRIGLAWQITKK